MTITASFAILEQLADERRRVLSDWRAFILLRRATFTIPASQRRWNEMPDSIVAVRPLLRRMRDRGELEQIPKLPYIYEVTIPYARSGPLSEEELLMEIHPYAALSHLSALAFHRLTDVLSKEIFAMLPAANIVGAVPAGTTPQDWIGLDLVPGRRVPQILGRSVHWTRMKPERYFGVGEYQPYGYTILVTTPERTLIDGLQKPELSGGIENVLRAWAMAADTLDLNAVVAMVERFSTTVLRQRVGFILEELGMSHPQIEQWQQSANRGGSSKMAASEPYASTFSERWNLSLNIPIAALRESA